MVPVALDERLQVPRHILLEVLVFPAPCRSVPLVEALVPHHDAHLVAEVQHLRRGTVVARAKRVRAHLLHQRQLAAHRRLVERHSQEPEVGVQIHSLELNTPSVQVKAVRRPVVRETARGDRKCYRANAEAHTLAREGLLGFLVPQRQFHFVQARRVHVPQRRLLHPSIHAPAPCLKTSPYFWGGPLFRATDGHADQCIVRNTPFKFP